MVLEPAEGTTNVIISQENLLIRVSDAEVVKPLHETHLSLSKGQGWLSILGGPVVDSHGPPLRAEGAIKDGTRVLVDCIQVDHPLGGGVCMEEEKHKAAIKEESVASFVVFKGCLISLVGISVHGTVVPVGKSGHKVCLSGISIAVGRNTIIENAGQSYQKVRRKPCPLEATKDGGVVSVGSHVGATNPPHQVSCTAIVVHEGGRDHGGPGGVDFLFVGPAGGKSPKGREIHIPVLLEQIVEEADRVIGRAKGSPRPGITREEARFPQGKENVAEGSFGTKTLT